MKSRIILIILSVVLLSSLAANGYLFYYYLDNSQNLSWKSAEVTARQGDIEGYKKLIANLENQNKRSADKINELGNRINSQIYSQYKELKWLKYENKDLGISFEYPNLWGDAPTITTSTLLVDWNDGFIKKCISGYKPEQFARDYTNIVFNGVSINILKFSKLSHLTLNLTYDCNVSDIFERIKFISDNSNITIDGYKGKYFSGLNEGGGIFKSYSVITDDLTVGIHSYNFDYLVGLKPDTADRFGDNWIEKLADKYSNDQRVEQLKLDLGRLDKFVASIKFTK